MPRENSFTDSAGRSLTPDLDEAQDDEPILEQRRQRLRSGTVTTVTTPIDRFRACVKKVIHLQRTSTLFARYGSAGAEPGVDPRRRSAYLHYGHIRENCIITLVDYSSVRASVGRMTNREFVSLLNDRQAGEREGWVKVRWINICGVSWDVISTLALHYDLHPLAVEDVLHRRSHLRSKADYYPKHLFVRVLSHTLYDPDVPERNEALEDLASDSPDAEDSGGNSELLGEQIRRESSPEPGFFAEKDDSTPTTSRADTPRPFRRKSSIMKRRLAQGDVEDKPGPPKGRTFWPTAVVSRKESAARKRREKAQLTLDELKKEGRVHVKVQPVSVFLLRNGTVISIFSRDCVNFAEPIMARLQEPDTGVRMSADASLLVQSLLDLVVDSAFDVVDAFHEKVLELEHDVLLKPNIKAISRLHILSGDLALHKRTMEPLKMVIYGLRRYDEDRCAALAEPGDRETKVQGFMSHKAKIYLADVHDHMEYILSTMDTFAGIAENLINYTFNLKSYEMNETMRRLTMATIIFLPLTLLTGYFGMNFESMWSVDFHTDLFFWEIAIPVMIVIIPLFLWPDFRRMSHYVQKRLVEKRKRKVGLFISFIVASFRRLLLTISRAI
ncbi:hypothetical protein PISMIDRAFT_88428 [Pisolithus microcarpus 441]|uniref:Magnesium transport protein CorA n=1 Tax=Pisolithus microcarpus 441 TaxID=765257 RepID=A0A0C9YXW1_9AGAM|nr:hypothetical protein BKA83DRAFT_88428 [Pisolithus microcarpus]KIK29950.1 hypothetical protein PISMIDRAFT_88428 [Pisolithus microcarpus 441]